jgi:hypothetical protein
MSFVADMRVMMEVDAKALPGPRGAAGLVRLGVALVTGNHIKFAEALRRLTQEPLRGPELARQVCEACLTTLPVDGVGVSLMTDSPSERALLGGSDAAANRIEEVQFGLGEGPCVTAFSEERPVLIPNLRATEAHTRWPMFVQELLGSSEIRGLFAFPMRIGAIGIGVLDLHRYSSGPLEEEDEALVVADAATTALVNYQFHAPYQEADLFDISWSAHTVVHQATGALVDQLGVSTGEALARLRAYAFRASRPLHAIAEDVLNRTLDLASPRS